MSRKQGDPCPHCKIGKLSVHPDRMIADGASHRTWLCDKCGKTCKDHMREIFENVNISETVSSKLTKEKSKVNNIILKSIYGVDDHITSCLKCGNTDLRTDAAITALSDKGDALNWYCKECETLWVKGLVQPRYSA